METLTLLDALDEERNLTETGRLMCLFPILPKHARMIVEAIRSYPSVIAEVIIAATFLSVNSPFLLPAGEELEARRAHHTFRDPLGDFVSYQRIHEAFVRSSNKARFCETHYLDLRTMNEIINIDGQLQEIVSKLGVPIGSGGGWDDYLCAVSRGLIQFVCERTGRGIYRSLTADKIQIHPGSLMFRENPPYIVAGEIVRTSRMYARSVSPLRRQLLSVISPLLTQAFVKGVPITREREKEKTRDFTNQMKIGQEAFPIRTIKGGRKMVIMEWEKLRAVLQQIAPGSLPSFKNMFGTIIWDGKEIFYGMKLSVILSLAPYLHTEEGVWEDWPAGKTFIFARDGREVCSYLPRLLCLCPFEGHLQEAGVSHLVHRLEGQLLVQVGEEPAHRPPGNAGEPGEHRRRARGAPPARRQGVCRPAVSSHLGDAGRVESSRRSRSPRATSAASGFGQR